jgi:hypothetical protein
MRCGEADGMIDKDKYVKEITLMWRKKEATLSDIWTRVGRMIRIITQLKIIVHHSISVPLQFTNVDILSHLFFGQV